MHRHLRFPAAVRLLLTAGSILALFLMLFPAPALAAPPAAAYSGKNYFLVEKQYRQAKAYYQNLLGNNQGKDRDNWLKGTSTFRKIYQANQDTAVAPKCLFMMGKMHHDMYERFKNPLDLGESIACYEDVATLYSGHRLADDALFAIGTIYQLDTKDEKKAARTFAKIVALYSDGDMAPGAATHLRKLRGDGAPDKPSASMAEPKQEAPKVSLRSASLMPIRHWSSNNYTRIVAETSGPVTFKHQVLEKSGDLPRRLYIDLIGCRLSPEVRDTIPIQDGLLRQVRNAQYSPDTVRVVLDTQSNISDYKVFSLEDPFRVVVDVMSGDIAPLNFKPENDGKLSLARQLGLGIRRIIIDPGHGGKDPGTVSPSGLKEKDIVLQVARMLKKKLSTKLDCEIILTRNEDVFIPLEERTAIANSREGDLFISIHVNAAPRSGVHGIETYVLDLATNQEAMRVAAQENATSARKVSDLQAILLDLIQNTKVNESVKLAEIVQDNMISGLTGQYRDINNLGVKKAPFIVLIGARMPAILTEIAFLSNPMEESRLRNDAYLNSLSEHIAQGVSGYVSSMNMAGYFPK